MKIALCYMRVSTGDQTCASQRHAIEQWLMTHPEYEPRWYQDDGISGAKDERPGLQAMLRDVEASECDAILVFRLDRISRRAVYAMQLLLDWLQRGIGFYAVDTPVLHLGAENPMRLTIAAMFSEFAEIERQAIRGRVKAGLAAAKARGVRLGAVAKLDAAQVREARKLSQRGSTYKEIAKQMQVSPATICRALQRREA